MYDSRAERDPYFFFLPLFHLLLIIVILIEKPLTGHGYSMGKLLVSM